MNVKLKRFYILATAITAITLAGCAAYRTDSNVDHHPASVISTKSNVMILENIPAKKYTELGPIEVSVKKLTILHKDPTKEQANAALMEKASALDADAVIKVTYESGIGLTSWGYIDAKGTAIKFVE